MAWLDQCRLLVSNRESRRTVVSAYCLSLPDSHWKHSWNRSFNSALSASYWYCFTDGNLSFSLSPITLSNPSLLLSFTLVRNFSFVVSPDSRLLQASSCQQVGLVVVSLVCCSCSSAVCQLDSATKASQWARNEETWYSEYVRESNTFTPVGESYFLLWFIE